LLTRIRDTYKRRLSERTDSLKNVQAAIEKTRRLRGQIALKVAEEIIPDDVGKEQIEALTAKLGAFEQELQDKQLPADELTSALSFAELFFKELPRRWSRLGITMQKRLLLFFFPNGLVALRNGEVRTADYPVLEQVKGLLVGSDSTLVGQNPKSPKVIAWMHGVPDAVQNTSHVGKIVSDEEVQQIERWLIALHRTFGDDWPGEQE
jgi:HAMP domain-containing protein